MRAAGHFVVLLVPVGVIACADEDLEATPASVPPSATAEASSPAPEP